MTRVPDPRKFEILVPPCRVLRDRKIVHLQTQPRCARCVRIGDPHETGLPALRKCRSLLADALCVVSECPVKVGALTLPSIRSARSG